VRVIFGTESALLTDSRHLWPLTKRSHRPGVGTANAPYGVVLPATCIPTPLEKRRPFPVDALVPEPIFASTHAITIDAPPEQVWPWIAQMGAGRWGWYSWDAIDNGGRHRAGAPIRHLR
jgi:hypothetical protein